MRRLNCERFSNSTQLTNVEATFTVQPFLTCWIMVSPLSRITPSISYWRGWLDHRSHGMKPDPVDIDRVSDQTWRPYESVILGLRHKRFDVMQFFTAAKHRVNLLTNSSLIIPDRSVHIFGGHPHIHALSDHILLWLHRYPRCTDCPGAVLAQNPEERQTEL